MRRIVLVKAHDVSQEPRDDHGRWTFQGAATFRQPQVDTPEFERWFAGSKIIDGAGDPLRVYHGAGNPGFSEFRHDETKWDAGYMGQGFYFSSSGKTASEYATLKGDNSAVYPVYLRMERPYKWDKRNYDTTSWLDGNGGLPDGLDEAVVKRLHYKSTDELRSDFKSLLQHGGSAVRQFESDVCGAVTGELKSRGYDGVVASIGPINEYVVFSPTQIKSAIGKSDANRMIKSTPAGHTTPKSGTAPAAVDFDYKKADERITQEMARCAEQYDDARKDLAAHHKAMTSKERTLRRQIYAIKPIVERLLTKEGTPLDKGNAKACLRYMDLLAKLQRCRQGGRLAYGATVKPGQQKLGGAVGDLA